jgi:pimeloyl-ACP methyl ester carboxylesterase
MTLMARHPDAVRSAVLDSINPPDPLPPPWVRAAEARADFFALCEHNSGCAAAYPDLAQLYRQTLQQLGQAPPAVPVPPWLHQPDNRAPLTASMFEVVIDGLLYVPTSYPRLPRLVVQVHDEDTSGFAAALAVVLAERERLNIAANAAVECRDRPQYRKALAQDAEALRHTGLYGICGEWSALGPAPVIPSGTAVPTLVLAGQFDPNASPALSHRVAELIGARAHWIEFPRLGHNVRQFSACATGIVAAFIEAPEQMPDASCVQRRPAIHFLPR